MYIDNLSIVSIVGVILAFIAISVVHLNGRREYRQKIAELIRRIDVLQQTQIETDLHAQESHELCCAILKIYPQALHGIDYHIGDDGDGPYIREWDYDSPEPDEATLKAEILKHCEDVQSKDYREDRYAECPSIRDQLDAACKARIGDTSQLHSIEQKIRQLKGRHSELAM